MTRMSAFNIIISVLFAVISLTIIYLYSFWLLSLCDLKKAPFIYGSEACISLFMNSKPMVQSNFLSTLISLVSSKVIIYTYLNDNPVVLKQLSSKKEFVNFDNEVFIKQSETSVFNISFDDLIHSVYVPMNSSNFKKLRVCPDVWSAKKLIELVQSHSNNSETEFQFNSRFWTIARLNPEPLILSLLHPPLWPVPRYFGSCGRLAVMEFCGERLENFLHHKIKVRANLSLQIINAALQFTFHHEDFSFYLMDFSPDNIVVNHKQIVKFIDWEHTIVVHKKKDHSSSFETWSSNHSTIHTDCAGCISFYPDDICSHRISDHNIYAVCKEIFSSTEVFPEGFLHGTKDLPKLIEDCVNGNINRFDIIYKIKDSLHFILGIS